jgi:hypothetical protein
MNNKYTIYIFESNDIILHEVHDSLEEAVEEVKRMNTNNTDTIAIGITSSSKGTYPDSIYKYIWTKNKIYTDITVDQFFSTIESSFCGIVDWSNLEVVQMINRR